MESLLNFSRSTTHYQNLFIDDMEERKKPVTVDVYGTTQSQAPPLLSRTYVERSFVSPAPMGKVHDETHRLVELWTFSLCLTQSRAEYLIHKKNLSVSSISILILCLFIEMSKNLLL